MSDATALFRSGLLASASYAKLAEGTTASGANVAALRDAVQAAMPPRLVNEFAALYPTVVTYFDDGLTGFQVAVFKDSSDDQPGNVTIAFRGTDKLSLGDNSDLPTGADIVGPGTGYEQIVAMVNWWLRESSPAGQLVNQYELKSYSLTDIPASSVVLRSDATSAFVLDDAGTIVAQGGRLADALSADPDLRVDVTGHSLGGHLAMAFSSLFDEQTAQVTVFNAPGFVDSPVNRQFFQKLGGLIPSSPAIDNVAGDEALTDSTPFNWIAGLNSRPGVPIDVAIENQYDPSEPAPFNARNHSIATLTDSLAVYSLLVDVSPALSLDDYKNILNQVSANSSSGYERIVDTLESLFRVNDSYLPIGNDNREALYQALYGDGDKLVGLANDATYRGMLQIAPSEPAAATLLSQIHGASGLDKLAYSYAITRLNAFVAFDTADAGLYAQFQAGGDDAGKLDPYDVATNPQGLTNSYLADRANFLERKLWFNSQDINPVNPAPQDPGAPAFLTDSTLFADAASGYVIAQGFQPAYPFDNVRRYYFGSDAPDEAIGGQVEDHLYGGGGTDILQGDLGPDYLEGGAGLDVYLFKSGDGADTVLDSDGEGLLVRDGSVMSLGVQQSADVWALGNTTFTRSGSDLVVSFGGGSADSITLRDFDFSAAQGSGYMGIRLAAAAPAYPQNPVRTFIGDKEIWDSDNNPANGVQSQLDAFGNTILADGQDGRPDVDAADQADLFFGSDANEEERFVTGGGDDAVFTDRPNGQISATGGVDNVDAGDGSDIVAAGAGNDWVEGGTGADLLVGNDGDDTLYAEWSGGGLITIDLAIAQGESGNARAGAGDLLSGDAGNDVLISDAGSDLLAGGSGNDIIVGGAGDDTIYGDVSITDAQRGWTVTRTRTDVGQTASREAKCVYLKIAKSQAKRRRESCAI